MAAKKSADANRKKKSDRDAVTLSKIEKLARSVLTEATKGHNPAVEIRTRALSNVSFNEKRRNYNTHDSQYQPGKPAPKWVARSSDCSARASAAA